MATPKKLIVDDNPAYLKNLRDSNEVLFQGQDNAEYALFGPQSDVPEGIKHFESVDSLAEWIRENKVRAVLSGVHAKDAPDGERKYGFRIAKKLDPSQTKIHLHSNSPKRYESNYGDEFSGIGHKADYKMTLAMLDHLAIRSEEVANQVPKTKVNTVRQLLPEIFTVDAFLPETCEKSARLQDKSHEKAEELAAMVKDSTKHIAGTIIGFAPANAGYAFELARMLKQAAPERPVVLYHSIPVDMRTLWAAKNTGAIIAEKHNIEQITKNMTELHHGRLISPIFIK